MEIGEYEVIVKRKKIKNLYVRAINEHTLFITCPNSQKDKEIKDFILNNKNRIDRIVKDTIEKARNSKIYRGGNVFYIFGDPITIDPNENIELLYKKLNRTLLSIGNEYLNKYMPMLKDYGYHWTPVLKIRKMKSKWGVCYTSKNTIYLSTYLVHYPNEYIECIVLHEMCHFIVPNHSKRFL